MVGRGIHRISACVLAVALLASTALLSSCEAIPEKLVAVKKAVTLPKLKRINLSIEKYCPKSGYQLNDFFVNNASYRIENGGVLLDWDADGVSNIHDIEDELGLSAVTARTRGDAYGDLVVFLTGFSFANGVGGSITWQCDNSPDLDSDGDGLSDCEELNVVKTRYQHMNSRDFDSDGDGIPDELELRFGLNPLDPADALLDPSGDGLTNIAKVKMNFPINDTLGDNIRNLAVKYEVTPLDATGDPALANCFNVKILGMPLVESPRGNVVLGHFIEKKATTDDWSLSRVCALLPNSLADGVTHKLIWNEDIKTCPLNLDAVGGAP